MRFVTVNPANGLRNSVESFIRTRYIESYGADIRIFAPLLVAAVKGERMVCAAGLRAAVDGFFSEIYLDLPAESMIATLSGRLTTRAGILEVTSLCSTSPAASVRFIHEIANYGLEHGFEWSMFAATERLQRLLSALNFNPIELVRAYAHRVEHPQAWGRYYDTQPRVVAVHREAIAKALGQPTNAEEPAAACAAQSCALFLASSRSVAHATHGRKVA